MSDLDRYRLSFEQSAEAYEWISVRLPLRRVLDLGPDVLAVGA